MKKILTGVVLGASIVIVLFYAFNNYIYQEKQGDDVVHTETENLASSTVELIRVDTPRPYETISSPITVKGEARGYWFFEASFPIVVVDWDGRIIGEGFATADGEWMTEDFVPFAGTVTFDVPVNTPYKRGAIIFQKDNPSGLPENDDALEIPIMLGTSVEN